MRKYILGFAMATLVAASILAGCSDSDDGVYNIDFTTESVAGNWKIAQIDTTTQKDAALGSSSPQDLYVTFASPKYTCYKSNNGTNNTLQSGTFKVGRFYIALSHGATTDTFTVINQDMAEGKRLKLRKVLKDHNRLTLLLNKAD